MTPMEKIIAAFMLFILAIIIALIIGFISAIPLYFLWNYLAPTYFAFLPPVWLAVPFWHVVCLTWCLSMVRNLIMPSATATAKSE